MRRLTERWAVNLQAIEQVVCWVDRDEKPAAIVKWISGRQEPLDGEIAKAISDWVLTLPGVSSDVKKDAERFHMLMQVLGGEGSFPYGSGAVNLRELASEHGHDSETRRLLLRLAGVMESFR